MALRKRQQTLNLHKVMQMHDRVEDIEGNALVVQVLSFVIAE